MKQQISFWFSAFPNLQSFCFFEYLSSSLTQVSHVQLWSAGCASSSPESLNQLLSTKPEAPYTGRVTILIVGGAAEAVESKPDTYRVLIKRRKGFVRLALKNGLELLLLMLIGIAGSWIYEIREMTFQLINLSLLVHCYNLKETVLNNRKTTVSMTIDWIRRSIGVFNMVLYISRDKW